MPADGSTEWPLVGRARELASLVAMARPGRPGAVIAGPAGVGKSRMLAELAGRATRSVFVMGTRTLSAIPLGAFAPVLPNRPRSDDATADLLRWAADELVGTFKPPALVAVDDAHALDPASAGLLAMLVGAGLTIVATVRTGEACPDAVTALWKDGGLGRLDIEPLAVDDVEDLIGAVLGGEVEGATRRSLWEASEGNPLYLRELILGALESGLLAPPSGVWQLQRPLTASPRLHELVEARLADVDGDDRSTLEVLAVGEPLPLDLLLAVAPVESVERLEVRRHAVVSGGVARLAHPLHGEVVRRRLPGVRHMAIARRLSDAVDAGGTPPDPLRLARWRLDGGALVDPETLVAAATEAYAAHDRELADRLAGAAINAGGGVPARLVRLQVLGTLRRNDEVAAAYPELLAEARNAQERATVAMAWGEFLFWNLRQADRAKDVLAAVAATLDDDGWRIALNTQRATYALMAGDVRGALAAAGPALGDERSRLAETNAAMTCVLSLALQGRPDLGHRIAEAALRRAEEPSGVVGTDPEMVGVALVVALDELGRVEEATAVAAAGTDRAVARRNDSVQGWYALVHGRAHLGAGRVQSADRWFREAEAVFATLGRAGDPHLRWAVAGRIIAAAMRGDRERIDTLVSRLDGVPSSTAALCEPEVLRARGWVAWVEGDHHAARRAFAAAAALADFHGTAALAAAALHDATRLGFVSPEAAAPALERLANGAPGRPALRARHVAALASNDAAGLLDVAERAGALGLALLGAEAAAAAAGSLRRAGDRSGAEAAGRKARALADRCEGARPVGIEHAGEGALLTGREREVAELAATGLSSRQIAERLQVSPRTVDNLLSRAYQKLGITSRTELAAALA